MQADPAIEAISEALVADLRSHSHSDSEAFGALQQELRRVAQSKMRNERVNHTLQPTALVNEAFLKLFRGHIPPEFWLDPDRAIAYIARAMSQILNDHADAYRAQKRGGGSQARIPIDTDQAREFNDDRAPNLLDSTLLVRPEQTEEILTVRHALDSLRQTSPRQAKVVELLFYGGLTQDEAAAVLDVSVETIKLDIRKAKAFMRSILTS